MELSDEPPVEPRFCFVLKEPHQSLARFGKGSMVDWLLNGVLDELGWDWYFRESGPSIDVFRRTAGDEQA